MSARAMAFVTLVASFALGAAACFSYTGDPNAGRSLELPPSPDAGDDGEAGAADSSASFDSATPQDSAAPMMDSSAKLDSGASD